MNSNHANRQTLAIALLALALALMMFVFALRSPGQPLPFPTTNPDAISSQLVVEPEFVRTVEWQRDTNANSYVLTVNGNLYMLPAKGTHGSYMSVSNVPCNSYTNTASLYACRSNLCGATTTLRRYIERNQEDDLRWLTSTNFADYLTQRGTVTNLPASGKFRVRKGEPQRWFWMQSYSTNYLDERTL